MSSCLMFGNLRNRVWSDAYGSPMEIVREGFGSKKDYQQAISDLEDEIYWVPPPKQA